MLGRLEMFYEAAVPQKVPRTEPALGLVRRDAEAELFSTWR